MTAKHTRAPTYAKLSDFPAGSVAEWLKAPVLKTGKGQPFVSSNLTASARSFPGPVWAAIFSKLWVQNCPPSVHVRNLRFFRRRKPTRLLLFNTGGFLIYTE